MKRTDPPALKQTAESLLNAFYRSRKRHLILTGKRGCGKTTLLSELLPLLKNSSGCEISGFTTAAVYERKEPSTRSSRPYCSPPDCVRLFDRTSGKNAVIGLFSNGSMQPVTDGFLGLGMEAVSHALESESDFTCIDEIGFLEESCPAFCRALWTLFDRKRVIAVVRDQALPFLDSIRQREDVLVYRVDTHSIQNTPDEKPPVKIGAVLMASGESRRFGSNKLLADFHGKPLIQHVIDAVLEAETSLSPLPHADTLPTLINALPPSHAITLPTLINTLPSSHADTLPTQINTLLLSFIIVTRSTQIKSLCCRLDLPCILHDQEFLSDTIRIGLNALCPVDACLFLQGDQPLLSARSIKALILAFARDQRFIYRLSYEGKMGSPVLFPSAFFPELLNLPRDCGGNIVMRRHADMVRPVPCAKPWELADADTPEALEKLKNKP